MIFVLLVSLIPPNVSPNSKSMKKTLLPAFVFFSLFLFGCNRHQYVFVQSQQTNNETGDYLIENDSLEIRYNFSGENIPVNIVVNNKSDKPVYIDWKKCVAIIDGKKYKYWNEVSTIEISGVNFNNVYYYADGLIEKDERISYIPPRSYIETTRILLQTTIFKNLPDKSFQRFHVPSENGPVQVKQYDFSVENTPLLFRSILTFSSHESFTEETLYENTFWVSEIIESPHKNIFPHRKSQANGLINTSLITTKTRFGNIATAVTILGVSTGLIALSTMGDEE